MAMALYGVAIVVAPILGPVLGGYISDNYSWRWIFYINVPIGIVSLVLTSVIVRDPPTQAQKARAQGTAMIDYIGLGLLSLGLGSLEVLLDKGQEYDWFGSPFSSGCSSSRSSACRDGHSGSCGTRPDDQPPAAGRAQFPRLRSASSSRSPCSTGQRRHAADAPDADRLLRVQRRAGPLAAGFVTMLEMPVIGFLLSRGVDAAANDHLGLATVGVASIWMSGLNLGVSPGMLIWPRNVQMLGAGMMFVPINLVAYPFIPKDQTNNASGLFTLVRNEGSSIGVALLNTLLARHTQFTSPG